MRRYVRLALVVLVAFGLAACGGDGGGAGGDGDLTFEAVSGFEFEPADATVEAGEVTIEMTNEDEQRHTFVIDDPSFKLNAQAGQSDSGSVTLEAGTYDFYCDVPGHREAGMEGTLEVE